MGQRIDESTQEKGHRQLIELLQELRVALWYAIPLIMRMTGGRNAA